MRLFPYITILNTVQLFRLTEFSWWYVVIVIGAALAYLFESKIGVKSDMDVSWAESKDWQDFKKHFDKRMDDIIAD